MSSKSFKKWSSQVYPWVKWIFSALSIAFFYLKLKDMDSEVFFTMWSIASSYKTAICFIIVLAIMNWTLEGVKLKLLLKSVLEIKVIQSFFIVLGGMAISNFTPARTGEFIGRSLLLKSVHPIKVTLATVAGNIAQMLMTYLIGLLGVLCTFTFTDYIGGYQQTSKLIYVTMLICGIIIFIWKGKKLVEMLSSHVPKQIRKALRLVRSFSAKLYKKIVLLSLLRYV
ncbi:MAG: hypothetical protein ACPGYY_00475, partial [Bacteroidia bacterium]